MKKFIYLILLTVSSFAFGQTTNLPVEKKGLEVRQVLLVNGVLLYKHDNRTDTLLPFKKPIYGYNFLLVDSLGRVFAKQGETVNVPEGGEGLNTDPPATGYAFILQDSLGNYHAVQSEDVVLEVPEKVDTSGNPTIGGIAVVTAPLKVGTFTGFNYASTPTIGTICPVGTTTLSDQTNTLGYIGKWKASAVFSRNTEVITTATSTLFNITKTDNSLTLAAHTSAGAGRVFINGSTLPTSIANTYKVDAIWYPTRLITKTIQLEALSTPPTETTGQIYFDTESNYPLYRSSTGWQPFINTLSVFDTNNYKAAHASGAAYDITVSNANINMGGADPVLYLTAGTWEINYEVNLRANNYTQANVNTIVLQTWRINNTPAALSEGDITTAVKVASTSNTETLLYATHKLYYTTANANDIITLRGQLYLAPSGGYLQVFDAHIFAKKIQ